jgi:hypothetical protein
MVTEVKRMSIVKPTLQTCFHIDFDWWQKNDRDWHVFLRNYLCKRHLDAFAEVNEAVQIDWVDPETAEVQRVDGLQHVLIMHCAKQDEFITQQSALVDSVFRTFLANGNQPLNSEELGQILGRPAQTILRTLSGLQVLQGIRICTG